ncbi:sigma-70 family RNA polymerase sigma factor [Amycolatopsis echigonensis]|uniref:RNA polymerase sigma-70 factor (ECF subfamily) n=1 Tax=Amycolatopsis echigonensis TaxID=2576905 RepID=A0A2N3WI03_9PSEU|nr:MULTISPECIES: sigma-70 family RNA polymerase sigma factor [Amycolatopsis]MBB2503163.1 sigma-70 family RNA polymerase sigma factor [Amycolatopsis echigonensis]PKV93488.1 RNA polymerase sigma-70 factor (ECF subfamily) [Amycolatopsis niigatensis]
MTVRDEKQDENFWAAQFEEHRPRLRAVAYRMLGSFAEADDAIQETWLRVTRSSGEEIRNTGSWLTTIVSRQCLNMLRSRATRREDPLDVRVPDPVVETGDGVDPAEQEVLADSVGLALLVVLEALDPAERLAFVLHDMFAVPFDEIATMLDKNTAAVRQLASRARRRVQGVTPAGPADRTQQRKIADAWLTAARGGNFEGLVALLHPDALLRVDTGGPGSKVVRGAAEVAGNASQFRPVGLVSEYATVNGGPGIIARRDGKAVSVLSFTVADGLITEINILADADRVAALNF